MSEDLMTLSAHRDDDGRANLVVAGECDAGNVHELREAVRSLLDEGAEHLHIDLSGTTYMDSHGILALAEAVQRTGPGRLAVTAGHSLQRLLRITRLHEVLDVRGPGDGAGASSGGPAAHDGDRDPPDDG